MSEATNANSAAQPATHDKMLFWACFIALVATAFGFIIRALILDDWAREFDLSETQKGEIQGVGLWPFAVSIVLFSLVVDKIGYGKAMIFAFLCHLASATITIYSTRFTDSEMGYWVLYTGTLIGALGNGTVEAVINPVVATMFPREKTKWLNILHAGWPGGLVLGGLLTIALGQTGFVGQMVGRSIGWEWKVALIFIPMIAYGLMMLPCKFPIHERVAAGVPYRVMLQQVGVIGALIVVSLMVRELGRVFGWPLGLQIGIAAAAVIAYGVYVRSLGRPMFIFLVLIMIPLATTELGTDSWITSLMEPEMTTLGLQAGWVLVYTSFIMMVLRFFAGPIVHKLSPLGLLAVSSLIAAVGLVSLSVAAGMMILAAATLYGFGKTFFWPTMLGVVAERFPKGGALTLNTIAGVGMLGVGVVGNAFLGNIQDREIDQVLAARNPTLHEKVVDEPELSVFGRYRPLDADKVQATAPEDQNLIENIQEKAKKNALSTVAVFPVIMLICYLGLILYFRAQGGYKAEELAGPGPDGNEYTGGVEGPVE